MYEIIYQHLLDGLSQGPCGMARCAKLRLLVDFEPLASRKICKSCAADCPCICTFVLRYSVMWEADRLCNCIAFVCSGVPGFAKLLTWVWVAPQGSFVVTNSICGSWTSMSSQRHPRLDYVCDKSHLRFEHCLGSLPFDLCLALKQGHVVSKSYAI